MGEKIAETPAEGLVPLSEVGQLLRDRYGLAQSSQSIYRLASGGMIRAVRDRRGRILLPPGEVEALAEVLRARAVARGFRTIEK